MLEIFDWVLTFLTSCLRAAAAGPGGAPTEGNSTHHRLCIAFFDVCPFLVSRLLFLPSRTYVEENDDDELTHRICALIWRV